MLLWSLILFSLFLFQKFLNVNTEPPEKFIVNGVDYHEFFDTDSNSGSIRQIKSISNQLHLLVEPAVPLSGSIFFSKFPIVSRIVERSIDFSNGWEVLPSDYITCIKVSENKPSNHCLEMKINLEAFFKNNNEVIISFRWTNPAEKDTLLTFRVFQFVFNMEPMFPTTLFASENKVVELFVVNDKGIELKSLVSGDAKDTIELFSLAQDKVKFELLFYSNQDNVQCDGLLIPDARNPTPIDYSFNTYRPHLPSYLLFQILTNTSSNTPTSIFQSFYVDFSQFKSELMKQTLLFHLVCSLETGATVNSFQVKKESSDSLSTDSYDDEPWLPVFNAVKISELSSELVSTVSLNQDIKVPNENDPLLPPETFTKELQYLIPISKNAREFSSELFQNYVNVNSSFVKEVYIFDKEVPMDALETEQMKKAEIDFELEFVIPYSLKLTGNTKYSVQVQAVIWPKEETLFQTPLSTYFLPSFFTGTPSQPEYTMVKGELNIKNQFKKFLILKEIQGHKIELRFYPSNITHFTTFRVYLNPLQSPFTTTTKPSFYAREALEEIEIQEKVIKASELQIFPEMVEIRDLVLEEAMIDFAFRLRETVKISEMELWMLIDFHNYRLYSIFEPSDSVKTNRMYLHQELLQVTYLEELHNRILTFHVYIPEGKFWRYGREYIQVRFHVPSYIYKLKVNAHQELNDMFDAFPLEEEKFIESNKKLLSLVEFIYSEATAAYQGEPNARVYPHEFFTSFYLTGKKELHRLIFKVLKEVHRIYEFSGFNSEEKKRHYIKVLHTFFFRSDRPPQGIPAKQLQDYFLVYLNEFCDFISHSPKVLSLYVQSIPSPRFQSLFPNRVFSEHELRITELVSNLVTLCNYKKRMQEASVANRDGKSIVGHLNCLDIVACRKRSLIFPAPIF